MDRISVNIISPKLTYKGRMAKIFMFISFGLLFLCYPINLLTGDGLLFQSIVAFIFLNMLFWVAYYSFMDKYETIGEIVFDQDQIIVKESTELNQYQFKDITDLTISYFGYEDEPYLISARPFMRNSSGHDNVLSFKVSGKTIKYRFAIPNKTVRTFLYRQFYNYKNLGVDIRVNVKQKFVEF